MAMSWQGCVVLGHGNEVGSPPKKSKVIMLPLENGKWSVAQCLLFFFGSKFSDILWKKWRITWNLCFFWLSNACIFPQFFFWVTFEKSKNKKQINKQLKICNNSTLQRFFKGQCIVRHLKTHPSKFFFYH